jgi:hypothetical protein
MRSGSRVSNVGYVSSYLGSLRLLAVAACLWPAIAGAQPPDPTASDANANTAAGTNALLNVTGVQNTAIGHEALLSTTSGDYNTASGARALSSNTIGHQNTASGFQALFSNTTGASNTAIGTDALSSNTTGNYNTASGFDALLSNTTGANNIADGYLALFANTTGKNNAAVGYQALSTNTNGSDNVAVGFDALLNMNGNSNIALGINAGKNTRSGNGDIYIGNLGINGSESAVTRIGANQTKIFVAGIAGVPLSGATVVVRSTGQLGVVASSARYKQDIHPLGDASGKLAQLRSVSYRYKAEPEATHYGLIAEEVDTVMPELVVRDEQNRPESVQYLEIIPLLLQQWKAQQAENGRLHELIERQQARLDRQAAELTELRSTRLADNTALKN